MKLQSIFCGTSYVSSGTDGTTLTFILILLSVTQQHTDIRLKGCVHKITQISIQALNILALQKFMNHGSSKKIKFKALQCYIDRSVILYEFPCKWHIYKGNKFVEYIRKKLVPVFLFVQVRVKMYIKQCLK